jgi:hypothetical protein
MSQVGGGPCFEAYRLGRREAQRSSEIVRPMITGEDSLRKSHTGECGITSEHDRHHHKSNRSKA